ncbi:unnamed protein product [Lampetra planeri]
MSARVETKDGAEAEEWNAPARRWSGEINLVRRRDPRLKCGQTSRRDRRDNPRVKKAFVCSAKLQLPSLAAEFGVEEAGKHVEGDAGPGTTSSHPIAPRLHGLPSDGRLRWKPPGAPSATPRSPLPLPQAPRHAKVM